MSPVLDATDIQDETELTEEQQEHAAGEDGPVRSITLELPATCETAIKLLVQRGSDGQHRSGFAVKRAYETSPHEQEEECLPAGPDEDAGYEQLGDAAFAAAEMAAEWIQQHSADDDANAQASLDFLDGWMDEFSPDTANDSIFDDDVTTVGEAIEAIDGKPITPAESTVPVAKLPAEPTGDAQQHYDDRKHELEERIGKLAIEAQRLKAAIKCNREAMNAVTEELQSHLTRGPIALPLFDQAKRDEPEDDEECDDDEDATADVAEATDGNGGPASVNQVADDESWRTVAIEETGIDPKICKILREENNICTIGQIADYTENYELVSLQKIGQAKAEKIADALVDYWKKNPRQ